ncbi:hypothetical protein ACFLY6_00090 [Candidatus Dependentiae bacterium]
MRERTQCFVTYILIITFIYSYICDSSEKISREELSEMPLASHSKLSQVFEDKQNLANTLLNVTLLPEDLIRYCIVPYIGFTRAHTYDGARLTHTILFDEAGNIYQHNHAVGLVKYEEAKMEFKKIREVDQKLLNEIMEDTKKQEELKRQYEGAESINYSDIPCANFLDLEDLNRDFKFSFKEDEYFVTQNGQCYKDTEERLVRCIFAHNKRDFRKEFLNQTSGLMRLLSPSTWIALGGIVGCILIGKFKEKEIKKIKSKKIHRREKRAQIKKLEEKVQKWLLLSYGASALGFIVATLYDGERLSDSNCPEDYIQALLSCPINVTARQAWMKATGKI